MNSFIVSKTEISYRLRQKRLSFGRYHSDILETTKPLSITTANETRVTCICDVHHIKENDPH